MPHNTMNLFDFDITATTEIYTLSLHDALPISESSRAGYAIDLALRPFGYYESDMKVDFNQPLRPFLVTDILECCTRRTGGEERSEEHTSELQSRLHLVCRLLLEKKKKIYRRELPIIEATILSGIVIKYLQVQECRQKTYTNILTIIKDTSA